VTVMEFAETRALLLAMQVSEGVEGAEAELAELLDDFLPGELVAFVRVLEKLHDQVDSRIPSNIWPFV